MSNVIKSMPLSESLAYTLETPESPTHVGALFVFEPVEADSATIVKRVLRDFRASEVGPPFNHVPVFPRFGMPKWKEYQDFDPKYHVRHVALVKPGSMRQLLEMVAELHEGMMDRDRPGFMAYVIEGLQDNQFAVYTKIHHAYIDGKALALRIDAAMSGGPSEVRARPIWAPFPELTMADDAPAEAGEKVRFTNVVSDFGGLITNAVKQATGFRDWQAPLPFSAPKSVYNCRMRSARSLGAGSISFSRCLKVAKSQSVSVNEVVLTLVGAALERHSAVHGMVPEKPLIASCPVSLRREGDSSAGNQLASLAVKLGQPGCDIVDRLAQVHRSSADAKSDIRSVTNEAVLGYQLVLMTTSALLDKTPLSGQLPPSSNVNVSNIPGPRNPYYLSGAKMARAIPVSAVAMGPAINITVGSIEDRLDFAIIADAHAVPDAQLIAEFIAEEFDRLERKLKTAGDPAASRKSGSKSKRPKVSAKKAASKPRTGKGKTAGKKKSSSKKVASRRKVSVRQTYAGNTAAEGKSTLGTKAQ